MKIKSIYFTLFVFFGLFAQAKQTKKDSLLNELKSTSIDSSKVKILHQLYLESDSISFAFKSLELSEKSNYKKGIASSLLDIGRYYYFNGQHDLSLDYLIKSVKIAEKIASKKILASDYRYIGFIYRNNDPYTAEDYYKKSLKMCEELGDEIAASYALSAIGNIYEGGFAGANEDNKKALEYYLKSLIIRQKKGSNSEIASSLNETARIYEVTGQYDKAMNLRKKGLEIAEKDENAENIVFLCHVLGNDHIKRLHDYKNGLDYELRAYQIGKKQKNNFNVMYTITKMIANAYYQLGDLKKSSEFYRESHIFNDSNSVVEARYNNGLTEIKHDLVKELEKQKMLLKDSEILKVKAEAEKQTTLRNAFLIGFALVFILVIFAYIENRQKQKANKELDVRNKEIETAYQTLSVSENNFKQITETINDVFYLYNIIERKYEYISPNCSSILGIEPSYLYSGNSMKVIVYEEDLQLVKDANLKIDAGIAYEIEYRILVKDKIKWIEEKSSPIYDDNGKLIRNSGILADITERKENEDLLRKKNKNITDSILYARTIQDAILVPKDEIEKKLKDFFILLKPKDIVSGDFYFYKETKNGIILAVADCTGHGVPAGFLSMIGNAFLNEIVSTNQIISPSKILDQLSEKIIRSLNQNRSDSESKDGMDISLLCFDNELKYVQYAGAQNSLYIISNGELYETKGDPFPIGISEIDKLSPFTNNRIELQKGDSIYIFTDGYADQFSGPERKKFMKKQMKELLTSIQTKNMTEQQIILDQSFNDWKGSLDQVDDVLVIGVRI